MPTDFVQRGDPPAHLAYDWFDAGGRAPVLVYSHGLLSTRRGERAALLERWCAERGWSLLRFDYQGRGDSSGSLADLTLSRQIADLEAVLGALPEGARPVVLGSSYGGLTAAWHAALHPGTVAACILLAPAFGFVPDLLAEMGLAEALRWRERGQRDFGRGLDFEVDYELVRDAAAYPEALLATSLRTPTLIAHGTDDDAVPVERSREFARRARPGVVDLHVFSGADHILHVQMMEVLAMVEPFAARVGGLDHTSKRIT